MSLGGNCARTVAKAVNYAWGKGLLIIAAAGNGVNNVDWPARFRRVMAIGATDHNDKRASFSDYGKQLDLVAPGVDILSAITLQYWPDQGFPLEPPYGMASGTSMATPHAAGVAGLVWSANLALTNGQVWRILITSADDLRRSGWDPKTGWGRLNANNAVNLAPTSPSQVNQTKAAC